MAGHMPYLMPGGQSLAHILRAEREREQRRSLKLRGKDEQLVTLHRMTGGTTSDHELAELRAIAAAGCRRRRRWLNDKLLRDLAGPLSARDMEAQFKPAPFGVTDHVSPLTQAMQPENAALWENFRNIDPEREARVLERWAAHQAEHSHRGASAARRRRPRAPAEVALQRWSRVGKKARTALKRANPSSVLQLELQLLDFLEEAHQSDQLVLPQDDGFARLLVHGLAEFYGMLSVSKELEGQSCVIVYHRQPQQPAAAPAASAGPMGRSFGLGASPGSADGAGLLSSSPGTATAGGRLSSAGASPARGAAVGASPGRGAVAGASPGRGEEAGCSTGATGCDNEITCTDILLAMLEVGQMGLNQDSLQRYVSTHIHGTDEQPYHLQQQQHRQRHHQGQ